MKRANRPSPEIRVLLCTLTKSLKLAGWSEAKQFFQSTVVPEFFARSSFATLRYASNGRRSASKNIFQHFANRVFDDIRSVVLLRISVLKIPVCLDGSILRNIPGDSTKASVPHTTLAARRPIDYKRDIDTRKVLTALPTGSECVVQTSQERTSKSNEIVTLRIPSCNTFFCNAFVRYRGKRR